MKINIVIVLMSALLISCGAGIGDTSEDLGHGYTYLDNGGVQTITSDNSFEYPYIYPNVINYKNTDKYIFVLQKPNRELSVGEIGDDISFRYMDYVNYLHGYFKSHDSSFIKYVIGDSANYKLLKRKGVGTENSAKDINKCLTIADSLINTGKYKEIFSHAYNYYIIDKKKNNLFGPLNENEFDIQKKTLGFENIKLEKY